MGFVDIHSHVLYGLDDGARTVEDSEAMLRLAAEAGTTDIVATPHANGRYLFRPELIETQIAELRGRVPVRIHRGCDFNLDPRNIEDALAHPAKPLCWSKVDQPKGEGTMTSESNKPVDKVDVHPVHAAIWRDSTDKGAHFDVIFQRQRL